MDSKLMDPFLQTSNLCYRTVTCKVFIESTSMLLNRPQRKLGQSCPNSWHKIDQPANTGQACLVLLCTLSLVIDHPKYRVSIYKCFYLFLVTSCI